MAIKASTQITISKVIDIYACYRYYKLQSSTLAKPDKPTTNPPSGWSDTEPAYVSGSTNTLYFVDCNVYSDKSFSFSEVSKSSSYEAAKDAWNKANNAQNTVDNLEIGGRNLARKTSSEWTNWWAPIANKVNVCTELSYIYPGIIKVGDIFTVSFDIDIKKFTKSVDGNLNVFIQGSVDGGWTIVNPFGRYNITNKITSNDCTEHITYIVKIVSEAQVSSTKFGFGIRCDYSDGTGKLRLKNLKVERGNKATDWTPAPEDNIAKVDVEYYLSTSVTSLSGGSWSTTAPTWVNGKYMWSRTVTVDGAGNKTYSPNQNGVCIAGAKGDTGSTGASGKGVSSIVEQYYKSMSATSLVGGSWDTTYPGWESGKYIWTRSVIAYTDKTTTTTTAVCVTGDTGDSFNWNLVPNSYKMNDQTHQGVGGYATTVSVVEDSDALCGYHMELKCTKAGAGPYFSVFPKTDDKVGKIYSLSFEAKCSVAKTNNVRLGHESGGFMNRQSLTTEWKRFTKTWTFTDKSGAIVIYSSFAVGEILYIRDFKIEEGNVATKWAPAQSDLKGETGATGKGVKSTTVTYQASTSGTTVPTGTWQTSIPKVAAGSYLWTRTVITYTDNTTSTSYSIGKMGEKGDKGDPGSAGKDAIIISATAPLSPAINQLWQTDAGKPIKRWDGSKWVLHYISVENLDVQKLSAIAADLGTVTAGVIKNKAETVNFDVERGVFESWDTNALQSAKMSAGTFEVSAKDSSDSYVKTYLKYYGLFIHQINKLYGYSIEMSELGEDLIVSKLINNGQGRENVSLFKNLKRTPVAGNKVVTITKGKNYVKLMTASEAASILGIENGTSDWVSLAVSNGDARAFDARVYGAEYWNTDGSWYVYFNVAAPNTQPVRVNYILAPII